MTSKQQQTMMVVGIGASAGGLEALKSLLPALPHKHSLAYVVLQHQEALSGNKLPRLLASHTDMPVKQVKDGMQVAANCVHICPPGQRCVVQDGKFRLTPFDLPGPQHGIDMLFASLATQWQDKAVGIILSGSGRDGVLGAQEIKAAGGWILAQRPETAEFGAMPEAVINLLLADFIRGPEEIGAELLEILGLCGKSGLEFSGANDPEKLQLLLELLENETGFNFQRYKESMLMRRIGRRLVANKLGSLAEYLLLVRRSRTEARCLIKEIFITVTGFFRDENVFGELASHLDALIAARKGQEPVRFWSAGCATGEEAYSLAMILAESLRQAKRKLPVKIFATDIDPDNIEVARRGVYGAKDVEKIPRDLLKRYFDKEEDGYRVGNQLRDMVVFAVHDVATDAPFSRLDLLCCRNLLIYFNRQTQERLLSRFHFALRPSGLLLLGVAESVGKTTQLFKAEDTTLKLYRRQNVRTPASRMQLRGSGEGQEPGIGQGLASATSWQQQMRELFFNEYAPAAVLLDRRFELIHVHGDIRAFVSLPEGDVRLDVMHLAPPALRNDLRRVLQQAQRVGEAVRGRPFLLPGGDSGKDQMYRLVAVPQKQVDLLPESGGEILLVFEKVRPDTFASNQDQALTNDDRVLQMEQELAALKDQLFASNEALEAANQELQSLSEEFQSTTEELQSSNEEYQTTNEELESANEELVSVNDEIREKSQELLRVNLQLDHILNAALAGIIVLDSRLQVVRYSDSCRQLFALWPNEVDNIQQLMGALDGLTKLSPHIQAALKSAKTTSLEVEVAGRFLLIRVLPLKDESSAVVHSIILAFHDRTEHIQREQESSLLAAIVRNSDDAIIVHDVNGPIRTWNQGARDMFGYQEEEVLGLGIEQLIAPFERKLYKQYVKNLVAGSDERAMETIGVDKDGKQLEIWLNASVLRDKFGKPASIAVDMRDTSEIKATEKKLNALVESTPDPMVIVTADGAIQRINKQAEVLFGYSRQQLLGKSYKILIPERFRSQHDVYFKHYKVKPVMRQMGSGLELSCLTASGEEIPVEIGLSPVIVRDEATTLVRFRDIRQQKQEQEALEAAKARADEASRTKSRFLAAASHDLRQPLQSISMYLAVLGGKLSPKEKTKVLEQARMSLDTTNKLLNSLLNITKLESGKVHPDLRAFKVQDLLDRVRNTEMQQAREKSLKFSVVGSKAEIHSDPALLEQVVTNLVANAIKFTPAHGHVVLGCRQRKGFLKIQVSDNGPGIASNQLDVIFDEYRQLEYDGHYLGKGLGLGLSIVKLIAELMNLKLEVKSVPGRGSSFSVMVPLAPSKPSGRKVSGKPNAKPRKLSATLLLVEDDPAVMDSTSLFLEISGFKVLTARNTDEARACLAKEIPDLIITDYGLAEEQNGIQLVGELRALAGQRIPAIIITGDTSDRRGQEAREADCEIMCKPIEAQSLLQLIAQRLGHGSA